MRTHCVEESERGGIVVKIEFFFFEKNIDTYMYTLYPLQY